MLLIPTRNSAWARSTSASLPRTKVFSCIGWAYLAKQHTTPRASSLEGKGNQQVDSQPNGSKSTEQHTAPQALNMKGEGDGQVDSRPSGFEVYWTAHNPRVSSLKDKSDRQVYSRLIGSSSAKNHTTPECRSWKAKAIDKLIVDLMARGQLNSTQPPASSLKGESGR